MAPNTNYVKQHPVLYNHYSGDSNSSVVSKFIIPVGYFLMEANSKTGQNRKGAVKNIVLLLNGSRTPET